MSANQEIHRATGTDQATDRAVKADKSVLEAQKREDFAQLDSGAGGKKSKIFGGGCDFAR
jgi:hypothetical protein